MTSVTNWARKLIEPSLRPIARQIGRLGIKPNHLTIAAFVAGVFAVYFLLENWTWFAIFGITHIVLDLFDGSLARATGAATKTGKHLDWWSDRTIALLILVKCTWMFGQDPVNVLNKWGWMGMAAIIIGLICFIWYSTSKRELPMIYARSLMVILAILGLSWLIIPAGLITYVVAFVWQVWFTLNNL